MRICVVGGIFDKSDSYRATHQVTPETVLAARLPREFEVTTAGHGAIFDASAFDLVHVHHFGAGALRAALDPAPTPLVYTHHRPFVTPPSLRTRILGVDGFGPRSADVHEGIGSRLVLGAADAVVALSLREADFFVRVHRIARDRIVVIPNGIPSAPFAVDRSELADPAELVFVGQLAPFKRVDLLLDALALLPSNDRPILLLVFQVDTLRADLEGRAAALGLGEHVRFEGPKPPAGIAEALRTATALVLPSAMEALPSVLTEAMLAGVPVVATDVGGVREQVGRNGIVVPRGDPCALAAALAEVVRNRHRWLAMADDIRGDAAARFDVDLMVSDHAALYRRVADESVHGGVRRRRGAVRIVQTVVRRPVKRLLARTAA